MAKKKKKKKGKQVVRSRKIIVDGIQFQSVLESKMYLLLKKAGIKHSYEGVKLKTFKEFQYPNECWERATRKSKEMKDRRKVNPVRYTPDFVGENEEWFIEVKGRANESFPIRWKLFKDSMSERETPPLIFKPMNTGDCEQVVEILKEKGYARKTN